MATEMKKWEKKTLVKYMAMVAAAFKVLGKRDEKIPTHSQCALTVAVKYRRDTLPVLDEHCHSLGIECPAGVHV